MNSDSTDLAEYLRPTAYLDFDTPAVLDFARRESAGATTDVESAVRLFHAVRDGIRYDPYTFRLTPEIYVASHVLAEGRSFCIPKAILLAAVARAVGIPARLGFADVRNHLTTERLRAVMGSDLFVFHGFTELWLEGPDGVKRWRKATPTFNSALCEKFGVKPLEFDGRSDSLLHPFDQRGARHMEYVRERGSFADFPLEVMIAATREGYPHLFADAAAEATTATASAEASLDFAGEAKPIE